MNRWKNAERFLSCVLAVVAGTAGFSVAQGPDQATLLKPGGDSWPLYHGDYTGQRHSALKQITPQNVGSLSLAWAFQTGSQAGLKSSPLLIDGVLYFTVPDNVWAVDARSGHLLWHYIYPANKGLHIGQRGVQRPGHRSLCAGCAQRTPRVNRQDTHGTLEKLRSRFTLAFQQQHVIRNVFG